MFYQTALSASFVDRLLDTRIPRCFAAALSEIPASTEQPAKLGKGHGFLLLEDLAPEMSVADFVGGLSYDQLAMTLRALAKLHAPYWSRSVDKYTFADCCFVLFVVCSFQPLCVVCWQEAA